MTTKFQDTVKSGLNRIEQIKKNICAFKTPQTSKVEVYEMWDGIFEPEDGNQ